LKDPAKRYIGQLLETKNPANSLPLRGGTKKPSAREEGRVEREQKNKKQGGGEGKSENEARAWGQGGRGGTEM